MTNDPRQTSAGGLTKAQRRERLLRERERRRRRRRQLLGGLLFLVLLAVVFMAVWIFHGSDTSTVSDDLDPLDQGVLDDEAEESLYNGPPEATICFAGDISTSADQVLAVTNADGTFDFPSVFTDIQRYFTSDRVAYAVADFETTMIDDLHYGTEPYHNSPIELAGALRGLGFRLMSTANTYALNNGIDGVNSTINYLNAAKLRSVGTYSSQEERDINGGAYIRDIHHIKFAFLSYTKGTDSVTMPEGCEYALNTLYSDYSDYWSDLRSSQIRRDIQAVKDAGADVIVVLLHWGSEYNRSISEPQETLKNLLLQNGVDVIIGTHSHLVNEMGFEKVTLSDGTSKQCFVACGLGDFYTDPVQETAQSSLLLNLTFSKDSSGNVTITDANYVPIFNYIAEENGKRQFRLLDVYSNLAELKRQDMNSTQALLFNSLLSAVENVHTYAGEDMDVGPESRDQRIVQKALEEGPVSSARIRELQRQEKRAQQAAQQAQEADSAPEELS